MTTQVPEALLAAVPVLALTVCRMVRPEPIVGLFDFEIEVTEMCGSAP